MDKVFGVPMSGVASVLVALLALCLLSVAWVAWRRPVIFKLGVRNIPRRRAQTTLIVVGLMLSTLITSAALGVGDTVDHSVTSEAYDLLGGVDELVVPSEDMDASIDLDTGTTIDQGVIQELDTALADNDNVDGVMPILFENVPVQNTAKGQSEPVVYLVGTDPARLDDFGGIHSVDGGEVDFAALQPNEVTLGEEAAKDLEAEVGDTVTVFYKNEPIDLTVAAITEETTLGGKVTFGVLGMAMPLANMQAMTGRDGQISMVAISNTGDARGGLDHADAVNDDLSVILEGINQSNSAGLTLGIHNIKVETIDEVELAAQIFSGLFLVLGLFSVAAGVLLIVLIFTMLAAERRSEMGMERAIGAHRGQLIQQFIAEGAGYAILAGLVGSAMGVLATYGIAAAMSALFGEFFEIEASVTPQSMIVAYCLGVVITFVAVVGSSWKISRLNIVAAVRDIPDETPARRNKRVLVWGIILTLIGGLIFVSGQSAGNGALHGIGFSLTPFGIALIARYFGAPSRPVFSALGILILLYWLLPFDVTEAIFGELSGDFEMFFISGIFMVIGATILIVQNLDILLAGVNRIGTLFKSKLPAVRISIAYPGAAKSRTGMTIAMFSLIVFSLVMIATMNENFTNLFLGDDANAGWDVRADVGSANPVEGDFTTAVEQSGAVDASEMTAGGAVITPDSSSRIREAGGEWGYYEVRGMDPGFIDNTSWKFEDRAEGYADDAAIIDALQTQPNVVVIDAAALEGDDFGDSESFTLDDLDVTDHVFSPVTIEIDAPDGRAVPVTIIGVIDSSIGSLFGLYASDSTVSAIYPDVASTSYYLQVADPDQAEDVAKSIEAALIGNGAQVTSIRDELEESQQQSTGFLYLIQGFMGLGLFVGVAAVGVIAFRSVVERRQQIGVLRALGFQRSLVSLSFMIETAFVVGVGVIAGTAMGVILARNLFTSEDVGSSSASFTVPWPIISVILIATVVVALAMTWVPSRQAARIAPAAALRYE